MRESRTYGSVRGARGNSRPYRDRPQSACDALTSIRRAHACVAADVRVGTAEYTPCHIAETSAAFAHPTRLAAQPGFFFSNSLISVCADESRSSCGFCLQCASTMPRNVSKSVPFATFGPL